MKIISKKVKVSSKRYKKDWIILSKGTYFELPRSQDARSLIVEERLFESGETALRFKTK